ncbi:hypothetical protein C9J12_25780 [Photobacterium frigidiphilum]|uniref:Uncharacterized protein n=1 Tax=Photobacterium frigidiphilum TaxID=264736 RepID=A0A2T3J7T0_9GAMM|nr:hypothetical protein [Photobacterium frigidiphilum]PSU44810.1 hypothetical protein C9J12_25780 [Photobacterium frigidiphilum]
MSVLNPIIVSALILASSSTIAADNPVSENINKGEYKTTFPANPNEATSPFLADFKVKVTIKNDLGGSWYILDKQDEGTPQESYLTKPTRQPDGSIKKLMKGWRIWTKRVSPQSVKLSIKISNFDRVDTFLLEKTPTNKKQCQTFLLGEKSEDNTTVCISIPTSTSMKQEQGLW